VADGTSGKARGNRGIVVELEDETAALEKDPRRPATSSALAATIPDSARHFACATATYGGRREVSGGDRSTWQQVGDSPQRDNDGFRRCCRSAVGF
jgi:hypothetical protein